MSSNPGTRIQRLEDQLDHATGSVKRQPVPRVIKSDQANHGWKRTSQRVGYDLISSTAIGFLVGEYEVNEPEFYDGVGVFAAEYEIDFNQDTDSSGEADISVAQFTCPVHNERVEPGYMFPSVDT